MMTSFAVENGRVSDRFNYLETSIVFIPGCGAELGGEWFREYNTEVWKLRIISPGIRVVIIVSSGQCCLYGPCTCYIYCVIKAPTPRSGWCGIGSCH